MKTSDFSENAPGKLIQTLQGTTAYLPNPLPPELVWSNKLVSSLALAERSLSRLEEVGSSFPAPYVVVRPFIQREAVLSSQIEGTRTTFEELLTFEAQSLDQPEVFPDRQEVQNYVRALDYGIQRLQSLPISIRLIREIHQVLMQGVRGQSKTPGELRKSQNWIGRPGTSIDKARYVPPPPEEMQLCISVLEKYIHQESDLPALIKIALIHYQFEAIHPFSDGNGRMGRLLITFLMNHWRLLSQPYLYLSYFLEKNRTEYYDRLLSVSQKGDWEAWLLFFLEGIHEQAEDAGSRIKAVQELRLTFQASFAQDRNRDSLSRMVDYFISTPISSIGQAQKTVQMGSFTTIQRYIEKLSALGILQEVTGNARNRIYRADEILRVLQE